MIGSSPIGHSDNYIVSDALATKCKQKNLLQSRSLFIKHGFEFEKMCVRGLRQQSTVEERSIHQHSIFDLMGLSQRVQTISQKSEATQHASEASRILCLKLLKFAPRCIFQSIQGVQGGPRTKPVSDREPHCCPDYLGRQSRPVDHGLFPMLNKSPASTAVSYHESCLKLWRCKPEIHNRRQRHSAALMAVGIQTLCNLSSQPLNNNRETTICSWWFPDMVLGVYLASYR
jgi:hypothetical protein